MTGYVTCRLRMQLFFNRVYVSCRRACVFCLYIRCVMAFFCVNLFDFLKNPSAVVEQVVKPCSFLSWLSTGYLINWHANSSYVVVVYRIVLISHAKKHFISKVPESLKARLVEQLKTFSQEKPASGTWHSLSWYDSYIWAFGINEEYSPISSRTLVYGG